MSELCRAGWKVGGDRWWDEVQSSWFFDPHTQGIVHALELAYEQAREPFMREAARDFAETYDADTVTEAFWKPALDALGAPLSALQPNNGLPGRAERRRAERAARKNPTPGPGVEHEKGARV
jgi:hypothetical protein